jgi:N-acetylneuraminate synthase
MQELIKHTISAIKLNRRIIIQGRGKSIQRNEEDFIIGLNKSENVDILITNDNYHDTSLSNGIFMINDKNIKFFFPIQDIYLDVFNLEKEIFQEFGSKFRFYPVLWLTALKLIEVAVSRCQTNTRVYLSGIDLNSANLDNLQAIRNFHLQDYLLKEVKDYYNADGRMSIIRYGNDIDYPDNSRTNRENISMKSLYNSLIQKVRKENYVLVVAEITNNHFGSIDRLEKIVRLCKDAGADMIKVQKRDVLNFFSDEKLKEKYNSPFGKTFLDYRLGCELSMENLKVLNSLCLELEIPWFASVLDKKSLEQIIELDPVLVKLPSTISRKTDYLTSVNKYYKGDLVISTGYTDNSYIEFIKKIFLDESKRNVWLLHATSAYPTPEEQAQIAVVRGYSKISNENSSIIAGYSSHDIDDLIPMLAVGAGAKMIEKHVKLGNADWIHFDQVALDLETDKFKEFVYKIRRVTKVTGNEKRRVQESENHKY